MEMNMVAELFLQDLKNKDINWTTIREMSCNCHAERIEDARFILLDDSEYRKFCSKYKDVEKTIINRTLDVSDLSRQALSDIFDSVCDEICRSG